MLHRWSEIEPIIDVAMGLPAAEVDAYLAKACGDDDALRGAVERLLAADRQAERVADSLQSQRLEPSLLGSRFGAFELTEQIGEGGSGRVYQARRIDGDFEQQVAIKLLSGSVSSSAQARFQTECQNLARLDHANIVQLHDGGITDAGTCYLVMQLVQGLPLDRYVRQRQCSLVDRLAIFDQLCAGVEYAHRHLIVHRDLKPSNVIVNEQGKVKLVDFGISKDIGSEQTMTQSLLTPRYAAPEQILGESITTSTDVYGLGAILHELLADQPPFSDQSDSMRGVVERAKKDAPPPSIVCRRPAIRRQLRGDLDAIVTQCLRADPSQRYSSVSSLRRDLQLYRQGRTISARNPGPLDRFGRFISRHKLATAVALSLIATISLAVTYHIRILDTERERATATVDFLSGLMEDLNPAYRDVSNANQIALADFYDLGLRRVNDSAVDANGKAALTDIFARGLLASGDFEAALLAAEQSSARAAAVNPNSQLHIEALIHQAETLTLMSRADEARTLLADLQSRLGDRIATGSALAARLLNALALNSDSAGDYQSAIDYAQQAESILAVLEPTQATVREQTEALELLASALETSEQLELAWKTRRKAIALREQWFGVDHYMTARLLAGQATLAQARGEFETALTLNRRALAITADRLGADHHAALTIRNNLAVVLISLGRFDEAIAQARSVLEARVRQNWSGEELADTEQNLATALRESGAPQEAMQLAASARARYAESLPQGHWKIGIPDILRAELALSVGEPSQALRFARASVSALTQLPSDSLAVKAATALMLVAEERVNQCLSQPSVSQAKQLEQWKIDFAAHPIGKYLVDKDGFAACP